MNTFYLKRGDTLPVLQKTLLNPDGTVCNLTSSTAWKLHIWLSDGTKVTRDMSVAGSPTLGTVQYAWSADDWDEDNVDGFLIVSPTTPLKPGEREHRMEYEVTWPGGISETFPNGPDAEGFAYDVLQITEDIA